MKKLLLITVILTLLILSFFSYQKFIKNDRFLVSEIAAFGAEVNPKADNPDVAAFQNYLQTVDPKAERVPVERLYNTQKRIDQKHFLRANELEWAQIPTEMGGRTRALEWDPNDEDTAKVWAGSVSGGLWYNNNIHHDTSSWHPAADFWPSLSVSSIAFDPNSTNVMYVGTGEAETAVITYRESGGRGTGIMKSTDGGQTWDLLTSTEQFFYVTDVVVRDENGASVVYAGVSSGVYMGDEHQSGPSNGLYRSTDGGATWTQVLPEVATSGAPPVSDIELTAAGRIFVGTMNTVDGQSGSEIFYSDEGTSGSWTHYTAIADQIVQQPDYNLTGRVKLAAAPSDTSVIYAVFSVGTVDNLLQGFPTWEGKYFLRSDDQGETWTEINLPESSGNQWAYLAWHALVIEVDPNNADRLWAGGLDLHRSDDGGQTWQKYSDWVYMYYGGGPQYAHADQHAIAFKPGASSIAVFGTDGGVFYTDNANGSTTFGDHNFNFNTLQFYSGKISPFEGNNATLGGLQDNGSLLYDGTPLSPDVMVSGGDGGYCYFDPVNEGGYISTVYENTFQAELDDYNGNYIGDYTSGTFTSPFAVDFENERIFANAVSFTGEHTDELLIVSDFYGNYNGVFADAGTGSNVPFSYIKRSPFSETNTRLWAGTAAGELYQIDVNGTTLTSTDITGTEFQEGFISCIQTAGSEDTLMVVFSNYGVQSVWVTVDAGEHWTSCEGNLPDVPVRYALFHPEHTQQVMVATETGLWETQDIFATDVAWELHEAFPHVRTDMIDIRTADNTLLAATHGRGMFTATWERSDYSGIEAFAKQKLQLNPNPVMVNGEVQLKPGQSGDYKLLVSGASGQLIMQKEARLLPGGIITYAPQQSGLQFITLLINGTKYTNTLVVQ